MLVLGMETSSLRGSVALVECDESGSSRVLSHRFHDIPNEHAERLLGLIEEALDEAGKSKPDIERIAVGVGPGSFTGIRVGLSIAQGLMLGLGVPGVGVGSLAAIAAGLPDSDERVRVVVRDARREEYFVAAYEAAGKELVAPHAIPQKGAVEALRARFQARPFVVVGTSLAGLACELTELTQEPDARVVARLGARLTEEDAPVMPHYVRGPNVVRPKLPPSPLSKPRS